MIQKSFTTILLFYLTLVIVQAQSPYHVRHYDMSNGLSNNWISQLSQDRDGFVWVATQYGLNRFDGKEFTTYTYRPGDSTSIGANWIKSLLQSSDGNFYLGTQGKGLNQMNSFQERFYDPLDKLKINDEINVVTSLTEDEEQNIYISAESGVYKFDEKEGAVEKIFSRFTRKTSIWKSDTLLLATIKGLVKSFGNEYAYLPVLKDQYISELFVVNKDSILTFSNNQLYLLTEKEGHWSETMLDFKTNNGLGAFFYWPSISRDQQGWIWIVGKKSVCKYTSDLKKQDCFSISTILNDTPIKNISAHCFLQDKEGSIWLGTNQGVFQLIPHKPFRNRQLEEKGFLFSGTREVLGCNETMWFATFSGLYKWKKGSEDDPKLIHDRGLKALHCGSDGFLYSDKSGDQNAILRIDPETDIVETIEIRDTTKMRGGACWKIVEDDNQRLWIARWNHFICYDLKTGQSFRVQLLKKGKPLELSIIDMIYDEEDNLWLGSQVEGLIKIPALRDLKQGIQPLYKQFLYDENTSSSISSSLILSLHRTKEGVLWVGTDGGLNRMDVATEKFTRFLRNAEMPDDKILSIISDDNGSIWMGTIGHGILSYTPTQNRFDVYTSQDGLYDEGMMLSSVFKDEDAMIWMGSNNGLHSFHPDSIQTKTTNTPNLIWSSIIKYRRDTTLTDHFPTDGLSAEKPLCIYSEDNSVSWNFSTLTFTEPNEIRYRFRLKGFHETWLPIQEKGHLTLTQIPSGHYTLEVESFSLGKDWTVRHDPVFVEVIPPWYRTKLAYFIYLLSIIGLISGLYIMQLRRKIAKAEKEHLQDMGKAKSRWFNQIAHEFRTPLTVILGSLDQYKKKEPMSKGEEGNKHLDQIKNQTDFLNQQVGQILEIARMKEGHLQLDNKPGDFISFQQYLLRSFSSLADEKMIQLHFSSSVKELEILFDEDKWRKISSNLLSNAIKYTPEKGNVKLSIDELKKGGVSWISLKVEDNGLGMTPDFTKQLFDPFTREQSSYAEGVGLGMSLTKELVELMDGNIKVASKEGFGSTFEVLIPVQASKNEIEKTESLPPVNQRESEKPLVLVAEDHQEILNYIEFCLAPSYKVITTNNGRQAWKLCQEHIPDLVISDIMMPEWTGLDLSKAIRGNLSTDHIPIILLTAKASHDAQIEGLKTGADVYLSKPFNREELMIRVNRLIEVRRKLISKFQKGDFKQEVPNEKIDTFLQSIVEVVEQNMSNEDFSILQLAESVHMSRVHLFRKIKSVAGMSPTIFIRKVRLKRAQELLGQKNLTIAEIAYQTGFKDPAYFTRVFVEEFGQTPSQFRN